MKNIIRKISWPQRRPNGIVEDIEDRAFPEVKKKMSKKRGKKGGIGCPDCPK